MKTQSATNLSLSDIATNRVNFRLWRIAVSEMEGIFGGGAPAMAPITRLK